MTRFHRVSAADALADWAHYEQQIQRVIDRANSGHDVEDVLTCLQFGNMQLWQTDNRSCTCITELQSFPRYKQLLIFMVAGKDAESWLTSGYQQLEAFAESHGCKHIIFQGRPGWERFAQRYGFGQKQIFMRKDLSHGRGKPAFNYD